MSAVFGVFRKDGGPADPNTLAAMSGALAVWGSDAEACWHDGPVGLGCRLFRTTPEARSESQPLRLDAHPHLTLVADVRLDNRDDLLDALGESGRARADISDSEVILRAWAAWGEDTPRRLEGDYAFIVWDARSQSLHCVRDHAGVRPMLFHDGPQFFACATGLDALTACPGIPLDIDEEYLVRYFGLDYEYTCSRSAYRAIRRLEAAHQLRVTANGTTKQRHWRPAEIPFASLPREDYPRILRAELERAVRVRLRSDRPIAAHLSGGLDSSAVAVLATRQLRAEGRDLAKAYSWSPAAGHGEEFAHRDERLCVEAVCSAEGLSCHYTTIGVDDVYAGLPIHSADPGAPAIFERAICRDASADGVGVILSGWGGDELASYPGATMYQDLWRARRWMTLGRKVIENSSTITGALGRLAGAVSPGLMRRRSASRGAARWLRVNGPSPYREVFLASLARMHAAGGTVRRTQLANLDRGHLGRRTERWAALGAATRIEYRYPLLDRRLMEFCLSIPPEHYVQGGVARYVYREAIRDLLPDAVRVREKLGDPAMATWRLRLQKEAVARFEQTLANGPPASRAAVHFSKVAPVLLRFNANSVSGLW